MLGSFFLLKSQPLLVAYYRSSKHSVPYSLCLHRDSVISLNECVGNKRLCLWRWNWLIYHLGVNWFQSWCLFRIHYSHVWWLWLVNRGVWKTGDYSMTRVNKQQQTQNMLDGCQIRYSYLYKDIHQCLWVYMVLWFASGDVVLKSCGLCCIDVVLLTLYLEF